MESKEKFYKRWWFWCIVVAIVIIMIIGIISITNQNKETSVNAVNTNNSTEDNSELNENPYEVVNDYDGVYSFLLLDNNGSEKNQFNSVGAIEIKDGECKVKYKSIDIHISEDDTNIDYYDRQYDGFCGINKEDNSSFYLLIKYRFNENVIYKCTLSNDKLLGELKSDYNLSGCSNKSLELIKMNQTNDLNTVYLQTFEAEKSRMEKEKKAKEEQEKQAFISSCQTYTFEQMARNPNNFKGTNVKLTGEVVQVMEGTYSNSLRVNITKKGTYSTYYTDTIYVSYTPKAGEDKILEDDIITIYGTAQGDYSYTSTMGASITLPYINAKYIVLQK